MSLFLTLVTFTRPRGMNSLQFKDFLSGMESQYGVFSAIKKLNGQVGSHKTAWLLRMKMKPSPLLHDQEWMCGLVFCMVINQHMKELLQGVHQLACQSHIEQRTATKATNWKFWLWELYTTVIKQYDKHPTSQHEDPTDTDAEREMEKEERLKQRWK